LSNNVKVKKKMLTSNEQLIKACRKRVFKK